MNAQPFNDSSSFWTESLATELIRFLTSRLNCAETAAELAHDTYLGLQQLMQTNPPDNLRAMAFRIAMNLAVDYQRKAMVRNRHAVHEDFDIVSESAACGRAQPDQALIDRERLALLHKAMSDLPAATRTVFILHGCDGLTYSEIAGRLGISKSQVNKLLAQAMQHCARQLAD
jgi:RNA polymerase sigma factor (sigma-70 family)